MAVRCRFDGGEPRRAAKPYRHLWLMKGGIVCPRPECRRASNRLYYKSRAESGCSSNFARGEFMKLLWNIRRTPKLLVVSNSLEASPETKKAGNLTSLSAQGPNWPQGRTSYPLPQQGGVMGKDTRAVDYSSAYVGCTATKGWAWGGSVACLWGGFYPPHPLVFTCGRMCA
jgi:hypothetical protein